MSNSTTRVMPAMDADALQFAHRMAAVVQVQRMLAGSDASPEELMDRIPEITLSVVEATGAVFELIDGDAVVLRAGTASAVGREAIGARLALEGSLTGESLRLARTVRCDDSDCDPRVDPEAFRKCGLRSVLVTIVRDRSGPIGAIRLVDVAAHRFCDADADSLELVAEALGAAIQRKRSEADSLRMLRNQMGLIQLQQDVASASSGLETALEVIARRAQELTGSDGSVIALLEGESLIFRAASGVAAPFLTRRLSTTASLAGVAIAGDAIVRCDDAEIDDRVDRAFCREIGVRSAAIAPLRTGPHSVGGSLILYAARTHAFTSVEVGTLQLLAEWLGVVLQRSAAAEQLRSSESQYRSLFASHPIPMWVHDIETLKFLAVNDSAIAEYGYSRPEFLSMTLADIRPPSGLSQLQAFLAARGENGAVATMSSEHRRKDGSTLDVEASGSNTRFQGRPARLVFVQDVTERRRVEREIQKSESLLSIASSVARVGAWSLDLKDNSLSLTDELRLIYDLPPGAACDARTALSFCVPEARQAIGTAFDRLRVDGTPYDLELELVTALDRRLWVRSIGQPVRDAEGVIVGARGAIQDISKRRAVDEEVRDLANSLKTTLESITDAFYTIDREWRFTYVNVETTRLLQRSSDDMMGRCMWELFPEAENGEFHRRAREAIERGSSMNFEVNYEPWRQWFEFHVYPSENGLAVYFKDITERHRSQERLLLLETCVASMKDVVVITEIDQATGSNSRIVFVNEAFVRHTGFSRAEAIGQTPQILQGPKTQRSELDRISAALGRREPVRAELINYTKAGVEYWLEIDIVPVWSPTGEATHFVAVERDATERRAAQEALRLLNESLEAKVAERTDALERSNDALTSKELEISSVVENMADGVLTFDDYGTVRSANSKVEEIFGQAPLAILGAHISLLIPAFQALSTQADADRGDDASAAIASLGRETYGRHFSGDPIAIEVAISDFRIGGQRVWTAIVRDIGERLRNMADLEQAKQIAEEASSAKSAFVATMSHEIRTPMNGVIGMIDVLHQTGLAPDQSRLLNIARDSAHALLAIIEDILDFSKIEAGRLELERLPLSLSDVVEKASALMQGMAIGKGVELGIDIDPRLPAAVWGDAGRLRQIVVNLASNAIKFSAGRPAAKVTVRAKLGASDSDRATLHLEVEDNGIGMDEATVERLFQPFSQADASTTRRFGGTGLGLAISHHLVGLMHGTFDVRSTPGTGSLFSVRMPFSLATDEVLGNTQERWEVGPAAAAPICAEPAATQAVWRVLVAEDNEINQQVITEQLTRLGYRAVVAANGHEALALWRGGGFDALLTDLQMPKMDGYELAATIRAEEGGRRRIPILALTANALKDEAIRCKASGMDDYFTKPVPMRTLDAMLQRWLGQVKQDASPVDPEVLPMLIGDDSTVIGGFMLDFATSADVAFREMGEAIASAHGERLRDVAHRLKSSARAVGAIRLGELCEAIEHAPVDNDGSGEGRFAAFAKELERVDHWIEAQGWSRLAVPEAAS